MQNYKRDFISQIKKLQKRTSAYAEEKILYFIYFVENLFIELK